MQCVCMCVHTHTHCSKKERLNVIYLFTWRDIVSNSEGLVFAFWFLFVVAYFNYYNEKIIQHFFKIKQSKNSFNNIYWVWGNLLNDLYVLWKKFQEKRNAIRITVHFFPVLYILLCLKNRRNHHIFS